MDVSSFLRAVNWSLELVDLGEYSEESVEACLERLLELNHENDGPVLVEPGKELDYDFSPLLSTGCAGRAKRTIMECILYGSAYVYDAARDIVNDVEGNSVIDSVQNAERAYALGLECASSNLAKLIDESVSGDEHSMDENHPEFKPFLFSVIEELAYAAENVNEFVDLMTHCISEYGR